VREELNKYEGKHKGTKLNIAKKHLIIIKDLKSENWNFRRCANCGEPSKEENCKCCLILSKL